MYLVTSDPIKLINCRITVLKFLIVLIVSQIVAKNADRFLGCTVRMTYNIFNKRSYIFQTYFTVCQYAVLH